MEPGKHVCGRVGLSVKESLVVWQHLFSVPEVHVGCLSSYLALAVLKVTWWLLLELQWKFLWKYNCILWVLYTCNFDVLNSKCC